MGRLYRDIREKSEKVTSASMSSQRVAIPSNTNAMTIARKPTKQQQTLNTKPRRPSRPFPYKKVSKLLNSPELPDTLPQNAQRVNALNAVLFGVCGGGEEEERNVVNSSWNEGQRCDNDSYLDSFPSGYRFCPLDEELVVHYLKKKVMKEPLPPNRIIEINISDYNPEKLAEKYERPGEKEMYFFTPRKKKYPNGTRPNRAAGNGYWKASGAEKPINFDKEQVGSKRTLAFYIRSSPEGKKTNWIMHEYTLENPNLPIKSGSNGKRFDDWVLCRIYKKTDKSSKSLKAYEDTSELVMNSEPEYMNQISQNETSDKTPYFSNNPLHSMANYSSEIFQSLNSNRDISLEMPEPLPLCSSGSNNSVVDPELDFWLADDIWSTFFCPELDFCDGSATGIL